MNEGTALQDVRVRLLGTGSSGGVPTPGGADGAGDWGVCDPAEPRNRRTRASILVRWRGQTILVDASPDCRQQLLDAAAARLDAVVFTHAHADHCHGIDDLRWINVAMNADLPAYGTAETLHRIGERFGYAFTPLAERDDRQRFYYKPVLRGQAVEGPFRVGPVEILPFEQDHGYSTTTGLRFGPFAFSTDVVGMCEQAFAALQGVDTWVVDCFRMAPHRTHAHLALTLEWIARVRPRRSILFHMSQDLDYRTLLRTLPDGVEPGYDGMEFLVRSRR